MDAAWTEPEILSNFRAPHGRAQKISEPLMDAALNFQNFRAPHGRARKISEPLMGAALNFQNFRAPHRRTRKTLMGAAVN